MLAAPTSDAAPARRWRGAVLVVALAVSLAAAERGLRVLRARGATPTGGAEWIWQAGDWSRHADPIAFYAACDFDLAEAPAEARLRVLADEEYWIHLNGRAIGAGLYRGGAALDLYDVGDVLHEGGNRLVAELRSQRGAGGFLAHLETSGGRSLCPTGPEWRIFSTWEPGLLRGWAPPDHGRPPLSWGLPPTGRWGVPASGAVRPRHDALLRAASARPPHASRPLVVPPAAQTAGQSVTLLEWEEEVGGFLELQFGAAGALAAVYLGDQAPDPRTRRADRLAITPAGEDTWRDAGARRFRFALVASSAPLAAASMWPVSAGALAPPPQDGGVLGLETPDLGAPVKDEVRRQLERLARLAGREEG